jgi:glycosyltransferase involved in cell wall biosynthesis
MANMQNTDKKFMCDHQEIIPFLRDNLSALKEFYPQIYACIEEEIPSFEISSFGPNNKSLNISNNKNTITISSSQREMAISKITKPENNEPVYFLSGIGAGDELQIVFNYSQLPIPELPNYKLPIYVIDPDPLMLITAMCLHDMRDLFESQRVLFFIGNNAIDELSEYYNLRQAYLPTHFIFHWYREDHPVTQNATLIINEAINKSSANTYKLKIKNNNYYNKISADEWRSIFHSQKRPLRIMGGTSRFTSFLQYCIRDLLSGFKNNGHETLLYIEESDITRTTRHDMLATIDEFKPDLIIYIDYFRSEFTYLPTNVPFINWIQDLLPKIINPGSRELHPLDLTYVFAPEWVERLRNIPAYSDHEIDVLHLGINSETYYPIKSISKTFDVLYVSHLVHFNQTLRPIVDQSISLELNNEETTLIESGIVSYAQLIHAYTLIKEAFDGILLDELWNHKAITCTQKTLISKVLEKIGIPETDAIVKYFCNAERITKDIYFAIKTRPLIALKDQGINIRIYGKNWEHVKELTDCARGPIENGAPLNLEMNQARICLNNSPGNSLHMRALEIFGSGCFMLSREINPDSSDIKKFFKKNEEIHFFKTEKDIGEIVKYWLSNNEKRNRISTAAREKALGLFNYDIIAKEIIKTTTLRCGQIT